jgi:hypothetical protein
MSLRVLGPDRHNALSGATIPTSRHGKGFRPERVLHGKINKRLRLLGMRERVEMVSGKLTIKSPPGKGTTIQAQFRSTTARGGGRADAVPRAILYTSMKSITVLLAEDHQIVRGIGLELQNR